MQGLKVVEQTEWYQHYLDCPMALPNGANPGSAFEAQGIPGCAVKSVERETRRGPGILHGAPVYHGKLKSIEGDHFTVIAHSLKVSSEPWFVWTGSKAEYYSYWDCD